DVCPHVVRKDCLRWMDELRESQSSIVLGARDEAGNDVLDVRVSIDGKVAADVLDGKAILGDPRPHRLGFEGGRGPSVELDIVVREGEKNRVVAVALRRSVAAPAPAPADAAPPPPSARSGRWTAGIVAGGLGVLALGIGAYFGAVAIH